MSCTPARIILGVLAPFMIGFGIYSTLISVEQFNIVSLLGSDSLKPNNDELVAREGGIGAAWIAKYNKAILGGLMFNKLDVDSEPTEQDAKATKHWLGVLVAHTPMITLDQINSALAKAEGGQRCYADALVSWGKTAMMMGAIFGMIKAICLLLAGVGAAIFGYCCKQKNNCLIQLIHNPASIVFTTLFVFIILQIVHSDYIRKVKGGEEAYYAILIDTQGAIEFDNISIWVYVFLPIPMLLGLAATLVSCCACDPEAEEEDNFEEYAHYPQHNAYAHPSMYQQVDVYHNDAYAAGPIEHQHQQTTTTHTSVEVGATVVAPAAGGNYATTIV